MHTIAFSSTEPLDRVCRALDLMRKMGFGLTSMSVDPRAARAFHVRIAFEPRGELSASTLVERVASRVGVYDLRHHSAPTVSAPSAGGP